MSILSDAAPAVQSVRGRQIAAALALAHLLEHDLPETHWSVGLVIPGQLTGHALDVGDELTVEQVRENLGRFAEFLGAEVTEVPETEPDLARLHVCGTYRGVSVRVWAFIGQLTGSAVAQS